HMRLLGPLVLGGLGVVLAGCEPALPEEGTDPTNNVDAGPPVGVTTAGNADGTRRSVVRAEYSELFAALDLDTERSVPYEENAWDLAFSRFHIRSRGGASGDGGVQVAVVTDAGFDNVTAAQAQWREDQPDGDDAGGDMDTVFERPESWFSYDVMKHLLSPQPWIYLVKSDQGLLYRVQIEGYYDEAGTPGILTLKWASLPP
ncbi:MAG: HmuY family protein, partial [Myxococcaceae bacterium]